VAPAAALPAIAVPIGPEPGPKRPIAIETNPYDQDRGALMEGRRLFVWMNCAGCHGTHAGGGMGPSLRDSAWLYGASDAAIYSSIAHGRQRGMPAWGTKLPRDQIWKLVAYVKSLGTTSEPEAPEPPVIPRRGVEVGSGS
jgi:cytochrome c oxidase cbb3-type subunit 3